MSVTRFDIQWHAQVEDSFMKPRGDGDYVTYDDYAKLEDERDRLRGALRDLLEESAPLLPNGSYELKQAKAALQEAGDE